MKYLIIGLTALLITFCSKEDEIKIEDSDYLIFGHFYGECIGEGCVEMFKLTEDKLFEDTTDSYLATQFAFVPLTAGKFEKVKDLITLVPDQLLKENEDTFGCPDCADQGGLYIEISDKGKTQSWRIDQDKTAVPLYLHDFMEKVNEAIDAIN